MGFLSLLVVAITTWWLFSLPASYLAQAIALYALLGGLIFHFVPTAFSGRGLGSANRVTLGRATLVIPLSVLVLHAEQLSDPLRWWIIVVSTIAMLLDGLDGWLARRTSTSTDFGARFDMELDAFLILALSILVLLTGQTGPWVILIGLLRYLFVAAGFVWSTLQTSLPASQRRKIICVVQGVTLVVCLGPIISSLIASVIATGALSLLLYSFAVDLQWLIKTTDR
jgi:phosphatidylglycerophosphate synthase